MSVQPCLSYNTFKATLYIHAYTEHTYIYTFNQYYYTTHIHDDHYRIMKLLVQSAVALLLPLLSVVAAASSDDKKAKEPALKPCTIRSRASGAFFDLSSLSLHPAKDLKDVKKGEVLESYHVKGQDYGANFTLNFCAPVVEDLTDVEGVDRKLAQNVSAYYTIGKKTYSIG